MFSNVKRGTVAFPTASLPMGVAQIRPPGQPAYGIVTPIPHEDLFTQGLAPEAIVGRLKQLPGAEGQGSIAPNNFVAGPPFIDLLHRLVSERVPELPEYQAEARTIRDGWLYVIDRRGTAEAPLVQAQDVLGAFAVRGGAIQESSYQRHDGYILLTDDGFSSLHRDLTDALMKALLALNAQQNQQPDRR